MPKTRFGFWLATSRHQVSACRFKSSLYRRGDEIARHPRLIDQRDGRHTLPGHHPTPTRADRGPALEEQLLRGDHPSLERYAAALKERAYGRGVRALRRLLELKRTYPSGSGRK
jgi:hypothetical protein